MQAVRGFLMVLVLSIAPLTLVFCVPGLPDQGFSANSKMTRSEFCRSLARAIGADPASTVGEECDLTGLDVNDVSFLWPAPDNTFQLNSPNGLIGLNDKITGDQLLLTPSLFSQVIAAGNLGPRDNATVFDLSAEGGNPAGTRVNGPSVSAGLEQSSHARVYLDYGSWKVTSLRVDPCSPLMRDEFGEVTQCVPQIRLVAQPLLTESERIHKFLDPAIHLIFNVVDPGSDVSDKESARDALGVWLKALKVAARNAGTDTSGYPLGVYPPLKNKGLNDPFALEFKRLLLTGMATFSQLTLDELALTTIRQPDPWLFLSGKIRDVVPFEGAAKVKTLQLSAQVFRKDSRDDMLVVTQTHTPLDRNPATVSGVQPNTAQNGFAGQLSTALMMRDEPFTPAMAKILAQINNPLTHGRLQLQQRHLRHLDCVSCHTADSAAFAAVRKNQNPASPAVRGLLSELLNTSTLAYPIRKGITPVFDPAVAQDHEQHYNVHNFSHFDRPTVTQRTVNESVEVAHTFNEVLGLTPEGASCNLLDYWICVSSRDQNTGDACLKQACAQSKW
jgi:hypothetical protein